MGCRWGDPRRRPRPSSRVTRGHLGYLLSNPPQNSHVANLESYGRASGSPALTVAHNQARRVGGSLQMIGRCLSSKGRFNQARDRFERAPIAFKRGDLHGRTDHAWLGSCLHDIGDCLWIPNIFPFVAAPVTQMVIAKRSHRFSLRSSSPMSTMGAGEKTKGPLSVYHSPADAIDPAWDEEKPRRACAIG
jgi:hypothetical protein